MNKPVKYPLAKLLNEKGLPGAKYFYDDERHYKLNSNKYTIAEVVMWIYEKHGIWISASPVFEFNDGREDYLKLQGFQYWITVISDNKYNQEKSHAARENKDSPTEAYEAAIEYTLKNLI